MKEKHQMSDCHSDFVLAIRDTMNVISGKWKLPIIGSLLDGKKRFKELERSIPKITPRMLSKELKDLEMNGVLKRTVYSTTPVYVEYELTPSAESLKEVLNKMVEWGGNHRRTIMMKN